MGDINRQMGMARGSDRSARATSIFRVIIEKVAAKDKWTGKDVSESVDALTTKEEQSDKEITQSIINLVDLAGSEFITDLD
jgi:hypothetical protein